MSLARGVLVAAMAAGLGSSAPVAARAQGTSGAPEQAARAPAGAGEKKPEPFAFADFTWLTGNPRTKESPLDTKAFTGEFRVDTNFTYSFNRPQDDTISGSTEVFRSGEFQLTQLGIGGDFHYQNVRGRLMTQFAFISSRATAEDRAVDHQRVAVLRQVQSRARARRTDLVEAERVGGGHPE